ncbi:MAG: DUF4097 family beta strand repeat-containing protein [Phycisphaerales bacterium]
MTRCSRRSRRSRRFARPATLLAALTATAALAAGCSVVSSSSRAIAPTAMAVSMPDVQAVGVEVSSVNGRIVITQDPSFGDAVVSAEARLTSTERAERFSIETVMQDGVLRVRPLWPDGKKLNNESCNIEITAPQIVDVDARTSNGSVRLSGGTGTTVIKSSNGSVTIKDRSGNLTARTSNGRIVVEGGSGPLDVASSNGSITIKHFGPGGDAPYQWRAATSNGSIRVELPESPSGRVRASTSNSKVRVFRKESSGAQTELLASRSIDLELGSGASDIVLSTSNGSIVVVTP